MSGRSLLKGAGCSLLLTLRYVRESLGPSHLIVYYHRFPLASVFLAVLVDLVVISLLAALAWGWIERVKRTNVIWPVLLASVLLLEMHGCLYYSHRTWAVIGGTFVLLALSVWSWNSTWFEWAVRAVGWSLVLLGFSVLWVVAMLAYMAALTSGHEAVSFSNPTTASVAVPRICWILFDELSYDQVYDHRASGLALPNFDRLYAESNIFSNVQPAGDLTDIAIPSMFLGRPILRMRSSVDGTLNLFTGDRQQWERFDASQTIFARAHRLGWTSGIVGWANPYCRLMADWVDDCYWIPYDDSAIRQTNMDPDRSVAYNAASMPLQWLHSALPIGVSNRQEYNRSWVARRERHYELAMEHARALIEKTSIRFQFIHLPLPHPPAFYDRKTRTFSDGGSYLDNLALADVALGELLDQLEKAPEWPETTVIVSGDHSWRPWIWQPLHLWTVEDAAASKGVYDRRPVLAIHLPGQQRGNVIASEFPAFELAGVLADMMADGVRTSEDLASHAGALLNVRAGVTAPNAVRQAWEFFNRSCRLSLALCAHGRTTPGVKPLH